MRIGALLAFALLTTATGALGAPDKPTPPGEPALVPLASFLQDNDLVRDPATGQTLLRFANAIANEGPGALVVVGVRTREQAAAALESDDNTMPAYQRVTQADGSVTDVPVGTLRYHAVHHHFHFEGADQYRLVDLATGAVVREAPKVSFCLADVAVLDPAPAGTPTAPRFNSCAHDPRATFVSMGVSVGWADVYGKDLAGQAFDVSGLMAQPAHAYRLESVTNPDGLLAEANRGHPATASVDVVIGQGVDVGVGKSRPGV